MIPRWIKDLCILKKKVLIIAEGIDFRDPMYFLLAVISNLSHIRSYSFLKI